ncbi:mycothione reductase [Nocardioides sp.]|uniref:mycothione reductase n=1 Tax=Nocardioides sp. TaxID=35761 RepID=UPI002723C7A7|nr:mycothione reductase [Nocardioides sp.]MDO9457606.1 mycothione reductase [Nocardioides sp.]
MSDVHHYDLIVVGAGSGNTIVDKQFDHLQVAIVEKGPFGGTCLNRGCIPSKMFIHPADVAVSARREPVLGIPAEVGEADWPAIRDRIFTRIDGNAEKGRDYRQDADNVDVYVGEARFVGERRLVVTLEDGGTAEIEADQVVLATGSRPAVPPIDGLDEVSYETSDTIMRIPALPARLGVLGGGYVGVELAHVFSAYGSEVVQVEGEDTLLANQDADVAAHVTAGVRRRYDVRLGTKVERVSGSGPLTLHLDNGSEVEVDVLLVAVGRVPNSDTLDLDVAGVETDDRGLVVVDEHQRTTAPGVWSLGDASSHEPLKHVANQDARIVQANLLATFAGSSDLATSNHRFVPQAVFAHPQVASVGLTEAQARDEHGDDVVVATHDVADIAYGWAMAGDLDDDPEATGFVKLLARRSTGLLVGAHVVGPVASVLVQPLIQAMVHDLPVRGLARSQYWIHPSPAEVVENALLDLESELEG